jgi:hypothetical protein
MKHISTSPENDTVGSTVNSKFNIFYPISLFVSTIALFISSFAIYSLSADFSKLFSSFPTTLPLATKLGINSFPFLIGLSIVSTALFILSTRSQTPKVVIAVKASTMPILLLALIAIPSFIVFMYLPITRMG